MKLSELDYDLPEELIAQAALPERDASRLLVVDRRSGRFEHASIRELPRLLSPGDLLVVNDARVVPARLIGKKAETGGRVELLALERVESSPQSGVPLVQSWRCLGQASKGLKPGTPLSFGDLGATVTRVVGDGEVEVAFQTDDLLRDLMRLGQIPLPPYIHRNAEAGDADRYQTVYARVPGAVAAPTAGLHFTPALLRSLADTGIQKASLTLLVGPGTFLPVRTDDLDAHRMRPERGEIPSTCVDAMKEARSIGRRVVAVGTTVVRAVEGSVRDGEVHAGEFETNLFIRPGYRFQAIDALVTNFHLPRSTLLALVYAFGGKDRIRAAYREAVARRYRFYSYGDAMLIL